MKNAIKLFLMDLKKIIKAPAVLVILGGVMILPSFYAWFNLDATWDPYGNTKNIKIAVVNEDKGDKVRGKRINVGDEVSKQLKKDNHFDWEFVSRKRADHDLKMGKYYAAMYIPEKFTHQITGTLRKDPQRADIEYKVNQKLNAIAPKMTDAGTSAIVQKANDKFNETVTKALLKEANRLGVKLENEIPTINKIQKAVSTANNSVPEINKFAKKILYLDENQDQIDNYADEFRSLNNYKGDVLNGVDKLNQVNSAIPALNEKAKLILTLNEYMPNIRNALNVASNDVPQAFPRINRGVEIASNGVDKGLQGMNDARGYLSAINQRVDTYQGIVNDAQNRNQEVNNRLQDNLQTSPQSTSKTSENNIKFSLMSTDGNSNKTSFDSEDANAMDSSLSKALLSLTQYTDQQTESTQEGIGTLEDIAYGILSSDKPEEFEPVLDNMNSRLEATSKSNQQFIDILSEIEDREDVDLSTEINKLEEANNSVNNLIRKQNLLSDALSKGSTGKAEAVDLLKTLPQVDRDLKGLRNYIQTELNQSLLNVSNQVTSVLNNGDTKLSTVQSKLNTISQVIDEGEAILKDGQNRIETIQNALPLVEQRYMDAMAVAQRYYPEFEQEVNNAASFVRNDLPDIEQRLADTTATVNENIPTIFNRYDRLVGLLDENQPEAKQKLHDLAEFIRNDLPGVEKDLAKADKLFDEIEDDDAVDKMVDLLKNDLKKQADVVANPIKINQEDIFPVKDYGSASTPFYTALACWVGALLMVSLLTTDNKHKELASYLTKREEYLGKSGLFYLIGIVQALIVSIGDIVILHAQVEHVGWFIGLTVLISIVFVTIVYTLVSLLGNPGKALAIILLVLQIAGGGGTFPIEVTPEFFQIIHPFIPFSYAVDALREAVGGYVPEILTRKVITLSLFGIIFLLIGIIFKPITDPIMRKVAERAEKSDVME
ncbi:YhgE/Pip domain-containing protein [Staphylococcus carnosus]|uniref:ABC-2 type transporter transmembrane domain-containing protein n=1 Tax=Staphylococcus carnosus (strain TM300) TaxID=396513 RepID=B9DIG0_STACT|nr:YhgE/Pip domain-containing protein [Staphylococcus carnosus]QPT03080.1 YhgE/Pip domain-containing protein [Staphylococcus carnosus]UQA68083.1 YhgE/Pip domain-containing protein [Staphylococcus carnosus]UTB77095.1 phage infection protein [Staphylococcus carnosus]UTB86645.1 phage infection protein [Staphylococcus carnosus]UTB88991.1 phage infection protein [Staphylococcus carnosus]